MISSETVKATATEYGHPAATLQVDVIADLICPWCYLGKKRLDNALTAVHGPSLVTWYPFQINPTMPVEGMPFEDYLAIKFGDPEKLEPGLAALTAAGEAEGVKFRFDKISQVPNTLNAHRLMKLAEEEGVDTSGLAENILQGFFEKGLNIADRDVLIEIGAASGLTASAINTTLEDDRSSQIVTSQEAQVRQSGVTGVPDFLVNKRLFVVGAQSTENLVTVFDRVMFGEESDQPVSPIVH
jgi:predicted DsbA family dithiol-disulfide isomerase